MTLQDQLNPLSHKPLQPIRDIPIALAAVLVISALLTLAVACGQDLGLYVHVEEIKKPFLARHFNSVEGNQYEGTVSDFTRDYRGTLELLEAGKQRGAVFSGSFSGVFGTAPADTGN